MRRRLASLAPPLLLAALQACGEDDDPPRPPSVVCTGAPQSGGFAGDAFVYSARLDGLGGACEVHHVGDVVFTVWSVPEGSPSDARPGPCTLAYDVDLRTDVTTSAFLFFEYVDADGTALARYDDADSRWNGERYVFPPGSCIRR